MKLGIVVFAVAIAACKPTVSTPTMPLTADQVTAELVDAGCLAPGPGVVDAVAAEQAAGTDPWLACLFDGGTVAACGAPCDQAAPAKR